MKTKCSYCGYRFPNTWFTVGGAVRDERGAFCSVRCQRNADTAVCNLRCRFCSQTIQEPFISNGEMFCSGRHANMYAMIKQRKDMR